MYGGASGYSGTGDGGRLAIWWLTRELTKFGGGLRDCVSFSSLEVDLGL